MDKIKQYRTLFHFPLPLTVVGMVTIGAVLSPTFYINRLIVTYLLILFGLVMAAYSLDARCADWKFLIKDIPQWQLEALGVGGVCGFVLIATYAILNTSMTGIIVAIFLMFFIVAYNIELPKWIHNKYGFAISWGSASMIGSYFYQSLSVNIMLVPLGIVGFLIALQEWYLGNTRSGLQQGISAMERSQNRKDMRKASFTALSFMCYAWFSVGMLLLFWRLHA